MYASWFLVSIAHKTRNKLVNRLNKQVLKNIVTELWVPYNSLLKPLAILSNQITSQPLFEYITKHAQQ